MALQAFVSAANLVGSGALSLGVSLLPELARRLDASCVIEAPDVPAMRACFSGAVAEVVFAERPAGSNELARLKDLFVRIPREVRRRGSRVCVTMGDIGPIRLACPHVIFCQQALLVYDGGFGTWSALKKAWLTRHFSASARASSACIVQTPVMARRLAERYAIDPERIHVIPQPAPSYTLQNIASAEPNAEMARCPKPVKLLFLAAYYPLKNHRILIPLAEELRRRGKDADVQIFLTLDPKESVLEELQGCGDVVTNLGRLPAEQVAGALKAADALFLPTLLESYGLVYLEALAAGKPVLTSDRDFARHMCGEFGIYFDPFSPQSIADALERLPEKGALEGVQAHLAQFAPDWGWVADEFVRVIRAAI